VRISRQPEPIAASFPHGPLPTPSCSELRYLVEKRRRTSPVLARPSPWTEDHQRSRSPTQSFVQTAPPLPAHPRLSPPPKVSKMLRLIVLMSSGETASKSEHPKPRTRAPLSSPMASGQGCMRQAVVVEKKEPQPLDLD
jgi:hypothetical protein